MEDGMETVKLYRIPLFLMFSNNEPAPVNAFSVR